QRLDLLVDAVDPECDVAEGGAELVGVGIPIVGELEHGLLVLRAIADERQGEAARGVVLLAEQRHAQDATVESQRLFQVVHAEHGVQQSHALAYKGGDAPRPWTGSADVLRPAPMRVVWLMAILMACGARPPADRNGEAAAPEPS